MERGNMLMVALLIIAAGVLAYALKGMFKSNWAQAEFEPQGTLNINGLGASPLETKTSPGKVSVDITPEKFEDGKLYLGINVNTHSVDLSAFDLKKMAALETGGRRILPELAPVLSGHHNSGAIVFATGNNPEQFTITIKGIPDKDNVRVFGWP